MKILVVHNRYLERGGEDIAVDLISAEMAQAGIAVREEIFSTSAWLAANSTVGQVSTLFYNREAARRLREAHVEFQPDAWVVHNMWPAISPSLQRTALSLQVPVIQYLHNWRPLSVTGQLWINGQVPTTRGRRCLIEESLAGTWRQSRLRTSLLAMAMTVPRVAGWQKAVKGWIGISDFMRNRFLEAGWSPDSFFTLRHPFQFREQAGAEDRGYYLFLGRLIEEKGVRVLLETWQQLETRLGAQTPRLIICGNGPLEGEVREAALRHSSVEYAGQVTGEQKDELLRHCRAMVVPSIWWEPLGLTPYEAYAFGKPALTAAAGGLQESVIAEKTGLLHEPRNAAELASHVLRLERNPVEAAAMGERGRVWLGENASPTAWRQRFVSIVEQTINR